jgi:hypothetical protein
MSLAPRRWAPLVSHQGEGFRSPPRLFPPPRFPEQDGVPHVVSSYPPCGTPNGLMQCGVPLVLTRAEANALMGAVSTPKIRAKKSGNVRSTRT